MPITGTPKEKKKKVFNEFKSGELHSGKSGKIVTNPKQAIAIALSEAGESKKKKEKKEKSQEKIVIKREREMTKETVGSCALKLINKSGEDMHSAIDQMREQLTDYDKNLELCVRDHKTKLEGDFYVIVITKKERLLQNVIRAYFFARISCPTPDYDQAVYKYDRATGDLRLLWIIPSKQGCMMMSSNSHLVPPEQHQLLDFVFRFRSGELFELAKIENKEPILKGTV